MSETRWSAGPRGGPRRTPARLMVLRTVVIVSMGLGIGSCPGQHSRAADWPQWRGPERDGVWRETGLLTRFASPRLEWKWDVPLGAGYCGPTVADGRVVVMDRLVEPEEVERVLCFRQQDGTLLWVHQYHCSYEGISYEAGPRACVTLESGRGYALGATGQLHCLNLETGAVVWQRDLNSVYRIRMPIWGIAAAPLIVGDALILQIGGQDGACVVALNKATGASRWQALPDRAAYTAPILIHQGGMPVVVVWTGDSVAGIAPTDGNVYWRIPFPSQKMPIAVATPVVEGPRLFVSGFYDGSLMLQLDVERPAAKVLWQRRGSSERQTDALHCMISTPVILGDYVYGVDSYGELRCLDARTGDRIWEDLSVTPKARWSNIHMVRQGDRFWMFNERGALVVGRLSPQGFEELTRAALIEPTRAQLSQRGGVCWAHPAYADQHVYARNDKRLVCASLAAPP